MPTDRARSRACGAQVLQESIQAELRKVRARADFEAAYLRRIAERRAQCEARARALQADVSARSESSESPLSASRPEP